MPSFNAFKYHTSAFCVSPLRCADIPLAKKELPVFSILSRLWAEQSPNPFMSMYLYLYYTMKGFCLGSVCDVCIRDSLVSIRLLRGFGSIGHQYLGNVWAIMRILFKLFEFFARNLVP